jgi:putative FmdB family regulatory protein
MPTYEYECKSCTHSFETFQAMSEEPIKDCPECGKEVRRLIFGGTGVIFKGSGFYVNDKSKPSGKTTEKKEPAAESKTTDSCSGCPAASEAGKCPAVKSA